MYHNRVNVQNVEVFGLFLWSTVCIWHRHRQVPSAYVCTYVHGHTYHIHVEERFGKDFNLAVWRIAKHLPNLISPIIKHDVFCNTHMHNSLSTYVRMWGSLHLKNRAQAADILCSTWPTTALLHHSYSVWILGVCSFSHAVKLFCNSWVPNSFVNVMVPNKTCNVSIHARSRSCTWLVLG